MLQGMFNDGINANEVIDNGGKVVFNKRHGKIVDNMS